jgi:hypothetical protein
MGALETTTREDGFIMAEKERKCSDCIHSRCSIEKEVETPEGVETIDVEIPFEESGGEVSTIECRKYPPAIFYDSSENKYISMFPEVEPDEWCSDFRKRN